MLTPIYPRTTKRNRDGVLEIGGVDVKSLAQQYGTPLFVLDIAHLDEVINDFVEATTTLETQVKVFYASKAFSQSTVLRKMVDAGFGVDVASEGELRLALLSGVPGEEIILHGNNKSLVELELALESGVSRIVIDSFDEIEKLSALCSRMNVTADVLLRLTLGIEAHTHEYIATSHEDQKFGLTVYGGAAEQAVVKILDNEHLTLRGFHYHIGSQIFESTGFDQAAVRAVEFMQVLHTKYGFRTEELNIGGGFGIAYVATDDPLDIRVMVKALTEKISKETKTRGLAMPKVSIEPGRALIGGAMVTLYEVGVVKPIDIDGGLSRLYVSVDGGMSDNIRTALYNAEYSAMIGSREALGNSVVSRVVGKHCESGDIVISEATLPSDIAPGDLLVVPATGAYHYSMSSNYNLMTKPAVIGVLDGEISVLWKRQTLEDLFKLDPNLET
jgi:diaminopimelate decarboxylase